MKAKVLVVGELERGIDELMTERGIEQAMAHKKLIADFDQTRECVYSGTGISHHQMAEILGLKVDFTSPIFGCGCSCNTLSKGDNDRPQFYRMQKKFARLDRKIAVNALIDVQDGSLILCDPEYLVHISGLQVDYGTAWVLIFDEESAVRMDQI